MSKKVTTYISPDDVEEDIYEGLRKLRGHRKHIRRIARRLRELVEHGVKEAKRKVKFGKKSYGLLEVKIKAKELEVNIEIKAKYIARHKNEAKLVRIFRRIRVNLAFVASISVEGGSEKQRRKPLYRLLTASIERTGEDPEQILKAGREAKLGRRRMKRLIERARKNLTEAIMRLRSLGIDIRFGVRQALD